MLLLDAALRFALFRRRVLRQAFNRAVFDRSNLSRVVAGVIHGRQSVAGARQTQTRVHRRREAAARTSDHRSLARSPRVPIEAMNVVLRNPRRTLEMPGSKTVADLLRELGLDREAHLVIRNGTLVPGDERLEDTDTVEVRPVISGG